MTARGLELGTAGEHIACADLLLSGHRACLAAAGMPYDILLDVDGLGILRVGVKATQEAKERPGRTGSKRRYSFHTVRHQSRSSGETSRPGYSSSDIDLLAFVALDVRKVGYAVQSELRSFFWVEADTPAPTSKFAHPRAPIRSFDTHTIARALGIIRGSK